MYPAEVENAILAHPQVEAAVVFGVFYPKWKEAVCAVCQVAAGQSVSEKELLSFVETRIAGYKKPRRLYFIDSLPLLKNGQVDREAVKKRYGENQAGSDAS